MSPKRKRTNANRKAGESPPRPASAEAPVAAAPAPGLSNSVAYLLLFGVICVALFFRFHQLAQLPAGMWGDEAVNGIDAMNSLRTGEFKAFYSGNFGREGLLIWLLAVSIQLLGNTVTALRVPSAVVGVLTVVMVFFTTRKLIDFFRRGGGGRLLDANAVGLLAALFLAASHWHTGFSRIAFRGILDPLFGLAAIYTMMLLLERSSYRHALLAGAVTGAGLYGYSSYRFVVFPLIFLVVFDGWRRHGFPLGAGKAIANPRLWTYSLVTVLIAVPLVRVVAADPDAFFRRSNMVSVFHKEDPAEEFRLSATKALGQFHIEGDPNWRHNYSGRPALPRLLGFCLAVALLGGPLMLLLLKRRWRDSRPGRALRDFAAPPLWLFLVLWALAGLTPAALTFDGRPHFLRSISSAPPVYILTALGCFAVIHLAGRSIPRGLAAWAVLFLSLFTPLYAIRTGYTSYFRDWAEHSSSRGYFMFDVARVAHRAATLPDGPEKYVVVGRPMHSDMSKSWNVQPIVYLTHTETEEAREAKRYRYITAGDIEHLPRSEAVRYFILSEVNDDDLEMVEKAVAEVAPNGTIIR